MKTTDGIISHWHTLIDDFNTSGQDFYQAVEAAVKAREVPDVTFSRVDYKEGGFASSKREYLRLERQFVAFDICAAPYGNGYFFSWWLARLGPQHPFLYIVGFLLLVVIGSAILTLPFDGFFYLLAWLVVPFLVILGLGLMAQQRIFGPEEHILMIPIIGWLYGRLFNPVTYYSLDTALMFQESVRRAVREVINDLLSDQGLQALAEAETQPMQQMLVE